MHWMFKTLLTDALIDHYIIFRFPLHMRYPSLGIMVVYSLLMLKHVAFYFVSFYLFLNFFGSLCIWIPNDPYLYNLLVCITIIIIHYIECGFYWNFLKSNWSLLLWLLSFEHYHAIIYQKKSVKFRSDLTQPKAS